MSKTIVTAIALALCSSAALGQARRGAGDVLEEADANNDGTITREEFNAARARQFARLDRNSDGQLDNADSRRRAAARSGERLAALRERLDANDDGKITQAEFLDSPSPLFDQAYKDGNGALDAKEIEAARAAVKNRAEQWQSNRGTRAPSGR